MMHRIRNRSLGLIRLWWIRPGHRHPPAVVIPDRLPVPEHFARIDGGHIAAQPWRDDKRRDHTRTDNDERRAQATQGSVDTARDPIEARRRQQAPPFRISPNTTTTAVVATYRIQLCGGSVARCTSHTEIANAEMYSESARTYVCHRLTSTSMVRRTV